MKEKILKHKNLVLFLVLVIAIGATYLFEERSNAINEALTAKKTALLDMEKLGDIKAIQGVKLNFEKKGEFYFDKDNGLKLSKDRLGEFFTILSSQKVKTFLNQDEVNKVGAGFYVPDPTMKMTFKFEKGEATFTLGKKLDYDQSFYMQVTRDNKSQIVIVNDESPDPGAYATDEEYKKSDAKYKRLEMIFLLTNKYFYDTRVFKDFNYTQDKINFKNITISTFRNKKYSVNFENSTTNPAAPKGIAYFEENWISFLRFLTKLEGKNLYYPADPKLLDEALSQFEVHDRDNRLYTLEVYKKYGQENGYFLKSSLDNVIYQLKPEDAQYFFVNVQDFWLKKVLPKEKEFKFKITFYKGQTEEVKIEDKELFKVLPVNVKYTEAGIRALEFKRLIEFFKTEGSMVEELNISPSEILRKNILRVQFENRNLSVILDENEATIVDLDQKIMIHHYVGAKLPFSIKYEDYFVAAKK
ncbi:MAG: hypothetical protein H7177_16480 [Rhizobacter sp.]|nr:hypothetical protein [Bacteriovorax sp.]